MYTSELNMRTKIAYVINDEVISTCSTCTQVLSTAADRESDVTWHHVIVHGCKGQKYLHASAHMPITGAGRPHVEGISTDGMVIRVGAVTNEAHAWCAKNSLIRDDQSTMGY